MPIDRDADEATKQEILDQRKRWLTLTRISPAMAQAFTPTLDEEFAFDQPYRVALGRVRRAMNLWGQSSGNLKLIAPATTDDPWIHISDSYPQADEVQSLARDFGAAWRAHDAARVNELAAQLGELIPTIHSDIYPGRSRTLELAYNKANLFQWGYATYLLALIVLLNKADRLRDNRETLIWQQREPDAIPLCSVDPESGGSGLGLEELRDRVLGVMRGRIQVVSITIPLADSKTVHVIEKRCEVLDRKYAGDAVTLRARIGQRQLDELRARGAQLTISPVDD